MKKKQTEPNLFTFLNQIYEKKEKYPYDKKLASAFMLSHWLAHDSKLIGIVNKINGLQFYLPDHIIYKYYFYTVPKGKRFIKWTKRNVDEKKEKLIEELKLKYNVSTNEAKKILKHIEKIEGDI